MAYEYTRQNDLFEDVCNLIKTKTSKDKNKVVKKTLIESREVFCRVGSVYEKEFYKAQQMGIKSQFKMVINRADYEDENTVEYDGRMYTVYRKYMNNDDIELYLREDVSTWNQ